jgi:hypothetical protein
VRGSTRARLLLALALGSALLADAPAALADDGVTAPAAAASEPAPQPAPQPAWYGWQILVADGVSYGAIAAAAQVHDSGAALLGIAGVAGFLAAGPVLHGIHHQPRLVGASVLMRALLPVLAGLVGWAVTPCSPASAGRDPSLAALDCEGAKAGGFVLGAGVGAVGATAFDATIARAPASVRRVASFELRFAF